MLFYVFQENKLKEDICSLEQDIARLENNPDKKIKVVVSPRGCSVMTQLFQKGVVWGGREEWRGVGWWCGDEES